MAVATNPRVLIVDDNLTARSTLSSMLREEQYEVVGELASGEGLLQIVKQLAPNVICLDQQMPGADGVTLLRALRSAYPSVAVVMITGSADASVHDEAVALGVAGFLKKPFTQAQLKEVFGHIDYAHHLLQALKVMPVCSQTGVRAVLADDSSVLRRLLRNILKALGVEVVAEASNGQQAFAMVAEHQPNFVCLDVDMPQVDGITALKLIHDKYPAVKVVMVTSHIDGETIQQAAVSGASGYIVKPYKPEQVSGTLHKVGILK